MKNFIYFKNINFFKIIEHEIKKTIAKFVSNKISKENDILNRIIKLILFIIMSVLKWVFNKNFDLKYCSLLFENSIMISLRKNVKFDYIIFKTYRLIVLLNIINKTMKSVIIIKLNYATKKHDLLLKKHFDERKNTFSKHVFHYLIKIIHSVWIDKKIVSLLLFDVIKIFDNVTHFKLLHNLKKRRIEKNFVAWINSFLFDRHIILKMMNYTTKKLRIQCEIFQKLFLSFIFYIFYNVDLIEWSIDFSLNIIVLKFINDAAIMTINITIKNNLIIFQIVHERCVEWCRIYESSFVIIKYELIHFRRFFSLSNSKMALKFSEHDLISSSKCKYLKMIMNLQFIWKHYLKYFKKKSFEKFNMLTVLIDSIWKMNIENLKKNYFVTMLFQFIFCVSIWFVFNEKHDYK